MKPVDAYTKAMATYQATFTQLPNGRIRITGRIPNSLLSQLRLHRNTLLEIVKINPLIVETPIVQGGFVCWVDTEQEKSILVEHGACPGLVYTRGELFKLVSVNSMGEDISPLTNAKELFDGALVN